MTNRNDIFVTGFKYGGGEGVVWGDGEGTKMLICLFGLCNCLLYFLLYFLFLSFLGRTYRNSHYLPILFIHPFNKYLPNAHCMQALC